MRASPACLVIDTNVLISAAILPSSTSAVLLRRASLHYRIAQSQQTWDELVSRIERPKFDAYFGRRGRSAFLTLLAKSVVVLGDAENVRASRDPDDDKFLGLALSCGAKFVVSGDKDLLSLGAFAGVQILNVRSFLTDVCPTD